MKHESDKSPCHPKLVSGRIAFFFLAAAVNGHGPVEKEAGFGYRSWLSSQMPFNTPAQSELQSELDRCRANEPTVSQRGPISPADRYNLTEEDVMGDDRRTRSNSFRVFFGVKGRCSCVAQFVIRDAPGNGRGMNDEVFLWEVDRPHDWGIGGENNVLARTRRDKKDVG